jgi:hypothetical protein
MLFLGLLVCFFCEIRCDRSGFNASRSLTDFRANRMIINYHILTLSVFVIRLSTSHSIQLSLGIILISVKSIAGRSSLSPENYFAHLALPAIRPTDRNSTIIFEVVPAPALCMQGADGAGRGYVHFVTSFCVGFHRHVDFLQPISGKLCPIGHRDSRMHNGI